jgi:hypothetical protein
MDSGYVDSNIHGDDGYDFGSIAYHFHYCIFSCCRIMILEFYIRFIECYFNHKHFYLLNDQHFFFFRTVFWIPDLFLCCCYRYVIFLNWFYYIEHFAIYFSIIFVIDYYAQWVELLNLIYKKVLLFHQNLHL